MVMLMMKKKKSGTSMTDTETKTLIAIKDSTQEMGYVQMNVTENEMNFFF